jgi:hypothetical protein
MKKLIALCAPAAAILFICGAAQAQTSVSGSGTGLISLAQVCTGSITNPSFYFGSGSLFDSSGHVTNASGMEILSQGGVGCNHPGATIGVKSQNCGLRSVNAVDGSNNHFYAHYTAAANWVNASLTANLTTNSGCVIGSFNKATTNTSGAIAQQTNNVRLTLTGVTDNVTAFPADNYQDTLTVTVGSNF